MHAVSSEGIEEDGQGGGKGLALTGEHLGNLALVQDGTAEQLHVEVHHGPLHVVASGNPMVVVDGGVALYVHKVVLGGQFAVKVGCLHLDVGIVGKAVGSALYDGKDLCTHLVQSLLQDFQNILLQLVYLLEERGTVLNLCLWNTALDFFYLLTQGSGLLCNLTAYLLHTGTQVIVAESLYFWIYVQYGLDQRTVGLQVARLLVAKKFN